MINILDYVDNDFLLTVRHHIPAGSYEKIRLKIEKIKSRGGDCDLNPIKVPSKKIDLNPRGGFYVEPSSLGYSWSRGDGMGERKVGFIWAFSCIRGCGRGDCHPQGDYGK